jgi:AcrR family transcriptional regulator
MRMVRKDWAFDANQRSAAVDHIYAAATDLILRDGLDAFSIDALASRVHCSKATIYRYAGGKAQIRDAVLMRLSATISARVQHAVHGLSGPERVVTGITVALEQIRSDPVRRLLLSSSSPTDLGELHASPALHQLSAELSGTTDDSPQAAQWLLRVALSLAYWPMRNSRLEKQMLWRYVAPAFAS